MSAARRTGALAVATLALLASACASTTYEDGTGTAPASSGSAAVERPTTTTATVTGSATELLPELATSAEALSGVMIDEGDDQGLAAHIAALWAAVEQEVTATRPDLAEQFATNVALIAKAVEFHRAADADKAGKNLRALVDAYLQ